MGLIAALFGKARIDRRLVRTGTEDEIVSVARQYAKNRQTERALKLLVTALNRFPESERLLGESRSVEAESVNSLIDAAERKLARRPTMRQLTHLCALCHRAGDHVRALQYGRQAILLDQTAEDGYHAVGKVYFEQFRADQSSIDGMNALRYLSKAHSLDPRNSTCLLQLTEVFLILHAPNAAMRFLGPVQRAFPEDTQVLSLLAWAQHLPPEETNQIQDLILWHEQRLSGLRESPKYQIDLPEEVGKMVRKLSTSSGVQGAYVVDGTRRVSAGASRSDWPEEELGEAFGMLADTARQNCQRMGIGNFNSLFVSSENKTLMLKSAGDQLMAFLVGDNNTRREDLEGHVEKLAQKVSQQAVGGAK